MFDLPQARLACSLSLLAICAAFLGGCRQLSPDSQASFAPGAALSEDAAVAADLQQSLTVFLEALARGEWSAACTDPAERERYAFFYKSLLKGARDARPLVLKSYPLGGGAHSVSLAFMGGAPEALSITRIVELEAVPFGDGFRFQCPYERRTAQLQRRTLGSVEFRFSGPFDEARAAEFVRLKTKIETLQGIDPVALRYDCFPSLEGLLQAYGLVFDASKCNFLLHDLGFLWDQGRSFSTGTGDERFSFGYVHDVLAAQTATPKEVFRPYVNGVAAYYGGYGLSGDSMEVLASQFRAELERRPDMDFLEEFHKGRGASVQRHFSQYVLCAFLCQEIVAMKGEAAALRLVNSGANGERFFAELEALIGVSEANFHASILRLIGA